MHTRIPEDELKVFKSLKNVKTVFDIGARDDIDYLVLKPNITLHAFEPNPMFFNQLKENAKGYKAYLNNFGCGEKEGFYRYNEGSQSIGGVDEKGLLIKRLDKYIDEHRIKRIDFLKIDVELYELKVIKGLGDKIKICRYIQYEKNMNGDDVEIEQILKDNGFETFYTGYRNQLAVRKGEKMPWIPDNTQEGGTPAKEDDYYLKLKQWQK